MAAVFFHQVLPYSGIGESLSYGAPCFLLTPLTPLKFASQAAGPPLPIFPVQKRLTSSVERGRKKLPIPAEKCIILTTDEAWVELGSARIWGQPLYSTFLSNSSADF
jgi:hypothetical protein